jgi:regulator of replication initiation timing
MSDISHVLRTVDDLAKRVAHLEEENKQLKRQLRPSTANPSYADRGGTDGDGRQLPYLGGLPGDPVALEAIESELRYLAKRLDNNAAEDEKAKQLQETRDEQQDELIKMCDLGVPRCRGAFTPSTRIVSISQ